MEKKWEYFVTAAHGGFTSEQMTWYGENGWELCAINIPYYYFKRQKKESTHD